MAEQTTSSLESLGLTSVGGQSSSGAVNRVAVVGGGETGQGIAEAVSQAGIEVILIGENADCLETALKGLSAGLDREIDTWGLTGSEKRAILARVTGSTSLSEASGAPFVIEAIREDLDAKKKLIAELDSICPAKTVIATNSASLGVTEIASGANGRHRVIGLRFLEPVPKAPVVEIARAHDTSLEVYLRTKDFAEKQLRKTTVDVTGHPGGITTRILLAALKEAFCCLEEGIATAEDIDITGSLGWGVPQGPLALADQMGLDVLMGWMENIARAPGCERFRPCPKIAKLVRDGCLGKKTGCGVFEYDERGNRLSKSTS